MNKYINNSDINNIINILNNYKNIMQSSVIYSNFYEKGLLKFSEFLNFLNIEYKIISPDNSQEDNIKIINDFKQGFNKILLLHPSYIMGINIYGVRQLHILEPMKYIFEHLQLKHRCIRYNGHMHLPKSKRSIKIFNWICNSNDFISKLKKNEKNFMNWLDKDMKILFFKYKLQRSNLYISPDNIIFHKQKIVDKNIQKVNKMLSKKSIMNLYLSKKCDIWTPQYEYESDLLSCYKLYI